MQGVNTNQHLQAILREDFGLAKAAGLTTVAIGVEDSADLATLTELGCDAVQGYICSAPCAAAEFLQWISEWERGKIPPHTKYPHWQPDSNEGCRFHN